MLDLLAKLQDVKNAPRKYSVNVVTLTFSFEFFFLRK